MIDEMDEIWALYADDGAQALDAMEAALTALQGGQGDPAPHVAALFRAVHTFKGNSRVLGLSTVESRAHLSEDLIGLVRDSGAPMDAETVEIMFLAADTLRGMLEQTAATRADADPAGSTDLMARLSDKIARASAALGLAPDAPAPLPAAPAPAPAAPDPAATPQPDIPDTAADDPAPSAVARDDWDDLMPEDDAPPPPPAPPPAPAPVAAPPGARKLIADPGYRAIMEEMTATAMTRLRALTGTLAADPDARSRARREADGLAHAARQMGLDHWAAALDAFMATLAATPEAADEPLAALILQIAELAETDLAAPPEPAADGAAAVGAGFFAALRDPLSMIAGIGFAWSCGEAPARSQIDGPVAALRDAANAEGYIRIRDAADRLSAATDAAAFRSAELRLYEELSAVEAVMPDAARAAGLSPRSLLEGWCADHAFDTLAELEALLDDFRGSLDPDAPFNAFSRLMRQINLACSHFGIPTAAQLSMSLVDLFSRVQSQGDMPDPILIRIARAFTSTIELVFDALEQGEAPDTEMLDKLFEETANVAFTASGTITATAIERRLGLPQSFHRVLSPESVRAAADAIARGMWFHVVRADINDDGPVARGFLDWLSGGEIVAITNVTVFRGEETLFDFLVASAADAAGIAAQLGMIDAAGHHLSLRESLRDREAAAPADLPASAEPASPAPVAGITPAMVESIGEIAASQAMVHHMLGDLSVNSLAETAEAILRGAERDPDGARNRLRSLLTDYTQRIERAAAVEAQLFAQIARLQEDTVALRSRPAETVLRPLEALVETRSRKGRAKAQLTFAGGDLALDLTFLEGLRRVLRALLLHRLDRAEGAPANIHIALTREEERIRIAIADDGTPEAEGAAASVLGGLLAPMNGRLRGVVPPGGGMRFHLSLPLSMVVVEGMVVGVGGVRYVLPVEAIRRIVQPADEQAFRVSAGGGPMMLRLSQDEIVAIHALPGRDGSTPPGHGGEVFVVLGMAGQALALPVDEVIGQQLVLLRPLRGVLRRIRHLTGLAILAGGEIGMVVSAGALFVAAGGDAAREAA